MYYIIIDEAKNPKNTSFDVNEAKEFDMDITTTHNNKNQLTDLGYSLNPRLEFDRSLIYPVILGINSFRQFKLKEFDHFAFSDRNRLIQFAYA